ncbi:unnamed protein product [Lactuca saligna]|uniref:Uncharacterized protein n=1 Tax=Lactuca saligna TaxID=75948 RepID=A0AA35YNG3_LACSI|nr:unnamed protein product [Lactuca saligna]
MLQKIDPAPSVLVNYLKTVNTDVETSVLLPPTIGPSKKTRGSKKSTVEIPSKRSPTKATKVVKPKKQDHSEPPSIVAMKPDEYQQETIVLPSKSGVLKKVKKMAHKPSYSSKKSQSFYPTYKVKTQINLKRVIFQEVQVPVSPGSKKRSVEDMAKHLLKKQKKKLRKANAENTVPSTNPVKTYDASKKVSTVEKIVVTKPLV